MDRFRMLSSLCRVTCALQIRGSSFSWNFMTIARTSALARTITRFGLIPLHISAHCCEIMFHLTLITFIRYITGRVSHDFIIHRAKIKRSLLTVCNTYTRHYNQLSSKWNNEDRLTDYYTRVLWNDKSIRFNPARIMLECFVVSEKYRIRWFWSKVKSKRTLLI